MDKIIFGLPKCIYEALSQSYYFWEKVTIPYELNRLPLSARELLIFVAHQLLLDSDGEYPIDDKCERRTLRLIQDLTPVVERGKYLFSIFQYQFVKNGTRINSRIENHTELPEREVTPDSSDYDSDFLFINDRYYKINGKTYDILFEGAKGGRTISVKHMSQGDTEISPCPHCHHTGNIKCPTCKGKGIITFNAGNYSSGEERIRSRTCMECNGTGKITCSKCNGTGQVETTISKSGSIIKSVESIYSVHIYAKCCSTVAPPQILYTEDEEAYNDRLDACCSTSFDGWHKDNDMGLHKKDKDRDRDGEYRSIEEFFDEIKDNGILTFLKRNPEEFIEDNRASISDEFSRIGLLDYYKSNEMDCLKDMERYNARGEYYGRKEIHYVFPYIHIEVRNDYLDFSATLIEYNGKTRIFVNEISRTSRVESLKIKLFSKSKHR